DRDSLRRGDVLTTPGAGIAAVHRIGVTLDTPPLDHGARVQVHHGTRATAARVRRREDRTELLLEHGLVAMPGDRFVIRSIAPPDTLGGGVVTGLGSQAPEPADPRPKTADPKEQTAPDPALSAALLDRMRA